MRTRLKYFLFFWLSLGWNVLMVTAQIPDHIPSTGLLAWYPFSGSANDLSGNGYHGTNNGATLSDDRFDNPSSAFSFGSNSYIALPEIPGIVGSNQSASISVWFRGGGNNNSSSVVGRILSIDKEGSNQWGIVIECTWNISGAPGDHRKVYFRCPTENNEPVSIDTFDRNTWHNITVVIDHLSGEYRYYYDAVLDEAMSFSYTPSFSYETTGRRWAVGSTPNSSSTQFYGQIDDLAIWNRELTLEEINMIYTSTSSDITPEINFHVDGSVLINETGYGLILKSPNGDCWSLGIDNNGNIQTIKIACPE